MMWVFAIIIVLVLGGIAAVAAGFGSPMAETYTDRPDALVPAEGPLRAIDLRRVRFSVTLRGYRMSEVDALLARLAQEAAQRESTPEQVGHDAPEPEAAPSDADAPEAAPGDADVPEPEPTPSDADAPEPTPSDDVDAPDPAPSDADEPEPTPDDTSAETPAEQAAEAPAERAADPEPEQ